MEPSLSSRLLCCPRLEQPHLNPPLAVHGCLGVMTQIGFADVFDSSSIV